MTTERALCCERPAHTAYSVVQVRTVDGLKPYYLPDEPARKRSRVSLSPRSSDAASRQLVHLQKDLRNEADLNRKLKLLLQYQQNGEYERVDGLITKWKEIIVLVVDELFKECGDRGTGLTRQQFLAALQLGRKFDSLFEDYESSDDCSSGESSEHVEEPNENTDLLSDNSVLDCLCQSPC